MSIQTGRCTELSLRGAVAMSGVFGYEHDPNSFLRLLGNTPVGKLSPVAV